MSESFRQIDFLKEALDRTQKERDEALVRAASAETQVAELGTKCAYLNTQVELLRDAQFEDREDRPPASHSAANRAKYQAVFDHLHGLLTTQHIPDPALVGEFDRMLTRIEGWGT